MPEYFDIVVIVPLEEELNELLNVFDVDEDRSTATELRLSLKTNITNVRILAVKPENMGKAQARSAAANLLANINAGVVVCLGIAGGLSKDLKLGDVCYSGSIIDVYENSLALDNEPGGISIEFSPVFYFTEPEITCALNFNRIHPNLKPSYEAWQSEQASLAQQLLPEPIIGKNGKEEYIGRPKTLNGNIVCGAVNRSEEYRKKLLSLDRKILAIETEAGGVFEVCKSNNIPAVTIRGISDYADKGKSSLEVETSGNVRRVAASNAITFLKLQLRNQIFLCALDDLKMARENEDAPQLELVQSTSNDVSRVIREFWEVIDDKLRELSPEYRLQPKGYRLPVPRVRLCNYEQGVDDDFERHPIEVRDALKKNDTLFFNIPRTYPDHSLAWVIALDLLTAEISGYQMLPIVIDGNLIRPPRSDFQKAAEQVIPDPMNFPGTQLMFVIENIPLQSETRMKYLLERVRSFKNAKFIFVDRSDVNIIRESEFATALSTHVYDVCEVSFIEVSHFIQKNFSMTGSEAEVIALRLHDTFNKYRLSSHPTYFAGIPRETLSALLQANRRTELMQLAVDGFLTFVVADDSAEITLSRTTRSRFLKRLAVALKVEKKSFNHEQIISFTQEFAREFDFEIDPIAFVNSFVEKGLVHYESGLVQISLPFIETYLLASELSSNEDLALNYFKSIDPAFDLMTFDLYAEIGASKKVVERVLETIESCAKELEEAQEGEHILLTDAIRPQGISKPESLEATKRRLRRAYEDVQSNQGNVEEKQRILDLADRAREVAAKQTRQEQSETRESDFNQLQLPVEIWVIATVLLGSGAEHLNAERKR